MAFPPLILLSMSFLVPNRRGRRRKARAVRARMRRRRKFGRTKTFRCCGRWRQYRFSARARVRKRAWRKRRAMRPARRNSLTSKELDPQWYAEQRQTLQAQIDADQEQIREIQQIQQTGDGISGAIPLDKNAPGLTPYATVEILQNQIAQSSHRLTICKTWRGATVSRPLLCGRFFRLPVELVRIH